MIKTSQLEQYNNMGPTLMGHTLSALGKYKEAISCYDMAIEFKPDDADAHYNKGNALSALGKYKEAISCFDKAIEFKPDNTDAYYNKGRALSALGKKQEAISCYDKVIEFKPDDAVAYYNKGSALSALGKKQEAISCYNKAIEFKPDYAFAYNSKGNALSALGDREQAISCFDKAIEFKPDSAAAHYNKGVVLDDLGRKQEAISCYDMAIGLEPDDADAYNNKGRALSALGRKQEAISCYDKAIEFKPDDAVAYYNKGIALSALGKKQEAISCYDMAIKFKSNYTNAYYNKGNALYDLGKKMEAISCYDMAKVIELLLDTSTSRTSYEKTILEALSKAFDKSIKEGSKIYEKIDVLKLINSQYVGEGINLNSKQILNTLFQLSIFQPNIEALKLLIAKGVNVNTKNKLGLAALHIAIQSNNIELIKLLFEYKANPDIQDKDGKTALHLAISTGNLELINKLLENNAKLMSDDIEAPANHIVIAKELLHKGYEQAVKNLLVRWLAKTAAPKDILHQLAVFDNPSLMEAVFDKKFLNRKNQDKLTPLEFVLSNGYFKAAKFLLEKGAKIKGEVLAIAIQQEQFEIMSMILDKLTGKINKIDLQQLLPALDHFNIEIKNQLLHIAGLKKDISAIRKLIEAGAEFITNGAELIYILVSEAYKRDAQESLKLIFSKSVDLAAQSKELVELAINQVVLGLKTMSKDFAGKVILADDIFYALYEVADWLKHDEMLDLLAGFNEGRSPSQTFLHNAVDKQNLAAVKTILSHDFEALYSKDMGLSTAINLAVSKGSIEILKYMLAQLIAHQESAFTGIDVEEIKAQDPELSEMLVYIAVCQGKDQYVKLAKGVISDFKTLIDLVIEDEKMLEVLLDKYIKTKQSTIKAADIVPRILKFVKGNATISSALLYLAIGDDDDKAVQELLNNETSFNNCLVLAAQKNNAIILPKLLSYAASNASNEPKEIAAVIDIILKQNELLLHKNAGALFTLAVAEDNVEAVELLLGRDIEVISVNKALTTPLHLAVKYKASKVAEMLISKGHDIHNFDGHGNLPLYFAVQNNDQEMAKLLIGNSADITIKDRFGKTPLSFAIKSGYIELASEMLKSALEFAEKNNVILSIDCQEILKVVNIQKITIQDEDLRVLLKQIGEVADHQHNQATVKDVETFLNNLHEPVVPQQQDGPTDGAFLLGPLGDIPE